MQVVPNQKNTPNRRRPVTGRNRNASQKVYASENDLPSYKPDHTASPTTPQKSVSSGSAALRAHSTNQRQRNKGNKNRNTKNGAASPNHRQHDRESPSFLGHDASAPIFAGSTFHASPAPSALPIPSFLGLAHGDSPAIEAKASSAQELSPPLTDSDEASPVDDPIPRNEESPLEFFFRADRAEKARVRRASSANIGIVTTAPFSPPHESPKECSTFPKAGAHNSLRRPAFSQRNTSPGISTSELNGNPRLPVGPAFSTPYQERIRAARPTQNSTQATPIVNRNLGLNSSEALKRYLFTGQLGQTESPSRSPYSGSPQPGQPRQPAHISSPIRQVPQQHQPQSFGTGQQPASQQASQPQSFPTQSLPRGVFPASVLAGHTPCTQSTTSSVHTHSEPSTRPEHILALEGDLRRMLKLDSLR
ncbi:hypothetical protein F5Y19DRAFT_470060 [Xylariaceae sp. FL1651]|nr:hypothetical protein F5Y19DRAFT_470060 [Xylariaceae sp. FL1651]